ncbi:MAG: class I SAM-dependent methyltransferase [Candidatus Bathyarchaeia archaeon]|jgi:SAM-dependent methyltransferase
MGNVFDEMGLYWAEIADADYTERQIVFLKNHLPAGCCVLDVACGSGRHTIALASSGFEVVGLDVSLRLLRIAKQRGADMLVRGDMRYLPFKSAAFKAVVSMDTSFGYLLSEAEDAQSLADIRRVLKPEGELFIDVFNRERLVAKYRGRSASPRSLEYPSFRLEQKRSVSEDGAWLNDVWIVNDSVSMQVRVFEHKVRLYKHAQLESLLFEAGLFIKSVLGDYDGQQFNLDSPRQIIIACVCP